MLLQQLFENCSSHYWALHPTAPLGSFWHDFPVVSHWRVLSRYPQTSRLLKFQFETLLNALDITDLRPAFSCYIGTAVPFVPPSCRILNEYFSTVYWTRGVYSTLTSDLYSSWVYSLYPYVKVSMVYGFNAFGVQVPTSQRMLTPCITGFCKEFSFSCCVTISG